MRGAGRASKSTGSWPGVIFSAPVPKPRSTASSAMMGTVLRAPCGRGHRGHAVRQPGAVRQHRSSATGHTALGVSSPSARSHRTGQAGLRDLGPCDISWRLGWPVMSGRMAARAYVLTQPHPPLVHRRATEALLALLILSR